MCGGFRSKIPRKVFSRSSVGGDSFSRSELRIENRLRRQLEARRLREELFLAETCVRWFSYG